MGLSLRAQLLRWLDDEHFAPEGGETLHEVMTRVVAACVDLIDAAREGNVAVVTHATPLKVAMAWALDAMPHSG